MDIHARLGRRASIVHKEVDACAAKRAVRQCSGSLQLRIGRREVQRLYFYDRVLRNLLAPRLDRLPDAQGSGEERGVSRVPYPHRRYRQQCSGSL